jgi:hypothetical protein
MCLDLEVDILHDDSSMAIKRLISITELLIVLFNAFTTQLAQRPRD